MHDRRIWSIALAAIFTLVIATGYVSAQGKSRTASEPVGDDADNVVTFRVRIQNISADSDQPILFAPGVWVLHSEAGPLFTIGEADRGQGLEALAEDGDPTNVGCRPARAGTASRHLRYTCLRRHAWPAAKQ